MVETRFNAMVQTPTRSLTLEAFLQQPDTKPASEYIDGQIIQKPMPKIEHSAVQGDLTAAINSAIKGDSLGRLRHRKGRAFPELRCVFAGRAIVPDVAVLPWSAIPRGEDGKASGEFLAAPDWMIEILSPGQSQTKVVKKFCTRLNTALKWAGLSIRMKSAFLLIHRICGRCFMRSRLRSYPCQNLPQTLA